MDDKRKTPFKEGMPGKKWLRCFFKRHPELSERKPELLGSERAVVTTEKMDKFYDDLNEYLVTKDCSSILTSPRRIFNCDESGFPLSGKMSKIIATKGSRTVSSVGSSNKSQVTVLATISASGDVLPPTIVIAGQRFKENPLKDGPEACLGRSESGWMTSEVFFEYVANSFIPWVEDHGIPKPVLLLVDGHSSHINYEVGKLCNEAGVELYPLPAHASHIIQPCDVAFFKPLKSAWAQAERQYRQDNPGQCVTKYTFASVFRGPWEDVSRRKELVKSAFRATGIFPFSKNYAKEKLAPASVYREVQDERDVNAEVNTQAPGPSGDATQSTSAGPSSFSLPLEKHLRYPQITRVKSGRRKGEDLPKCISSDAYLKYLREKQEAKNQEEEKKRKRKEERDMKKKAKEDGKRKTKLKNTEEDHPDIDVNTCPECEGTYDNDPDQWVGCCYCARWLHIVCSRRLDGLTDEEIIALDFKCHFC
ncbi:uncharacterized protein LOC121425224 [Lytechinus variegatus]|uniref:uncharacterized protein LOC121425224 n=1 Tax=Lytechinus variegatus TaxID=7654 RepID=UPI001BB1F61B|nr:uncharacterized protein LOC121425224 [Lytechinus variegatus]